VWLNQLEVPHKILESLKKEGGMLGRSVSDKYPIYSKEFNEKYLLVYTDRILQLGMGEEDNYWMNLFDIKFDYGWFYGSIKEMYESDVTIPESDRNRNWGHGEHPKIRTTRLKITKEFQDFALKRAEEINKASEKYVFESAFLRIQEEWVEKNMQNKLLDMLERALQIEVCEAMQGPRFMEKFANPGGFQICRPYMRFAMWVQTLGAPDGWIRPLGVYDDWFQESKWMESCSSLPIDSSERDHSLKVCFHVLAQETGQANTSWFKDMWDDKNYQWFIWDYCDSAHISKDSKQANTARTEFQKFALKNAWKYKYFFNPAPYGDHDFFINLVEKLDFFNFTEYHNFFKCLQNDWIEHIRKNLKISLNGSTYPPWRKIDLKNDQFLEMVNYVVKLQICEEIQDSGFLKKLFHKCNEPLHVTSLTPVSICKKCLKPI